MTLPTLRRSSCHARRADLPACGFVHAKDLRREVAEPVDKRPHRQARNRGGFGLKGRTSSNWSRAPCPKHAKMGFPIFAVLRLLNFRGPCGWFVHALFPPPFGGRTNLSTLSVCRMLTPIMWTFQRSALCAVGVLSADLGLACNLRARAFVHAIVRALRWLRSDF